MSGTVTDKTDNLPLIGASVVIKNKKDLGVITDSNGYYAIELSKGSYLVSFSFLGYKTVEKSVEIGNKNITLDIVLEETTSKLEEIIVTAKSEARKLRERAAPISVISMSQLQGTVTGVADILNKTVGVTIRSSGGVGSASRLSVRGLEGKRIGFFIDEAPLNDQSDFIDLNDIPTDMIDRIEIYKGVVPAKFGGSAMGGAVNIVIKEYPEKYGDFSYSHESFNTHKI